MSSSILLKASADVTFGITHATKSSELTHMVKGATNVIGIFPLLLLKIVGAFFYKTK